MTDVSGRRPLSCLFACSRTTRSPRCATPQPQPPSGASTASSCPAAGTWTIAASHSSVNFKVKHLGLAKTRGRFTRFECTVEIGDPADTVVAVEIDVASVNTHDPRRDQHLRGADFFDVDHHPSLVFRSTRVSGRDDE
jgi:polyisoprenoid-binding protein YceI